MTEFCLNADKQSPTLWRKDIGGVSEMLMSVLHGIGFGMLYLQVDTCIERYLYIEIFL